jgi:L,D-peptidoglycan transpeptidase YkuD (ErfK/YbiS/YcfS/YnhG family)
VVNSHTSRKGAERIVGPLPKRGDSLKRGHSEKLRGGQSRSTGLTKTLVVRRGLSNGRTVLGHLQVSAAITLPCALGATGFSHRKREGDKATPVGAMRLLHGYFRPDRISRPRCRLPLVPITGDLGWCDDPASPRYNRPVTLPMPALHETMKRRDGLYDVVFVLDYNIRPRRAGAGSAIFFHCAKPDLKATLGCVALRPADMRRLLPRLARDTWLVVR